MKQSNEILLGKLKKLLVCSLVLAALCLSSRLVGAPQGLTLTVGSTNGATGGIVLVPILVSGFSNIGTFQFSFRFDPANAAFIDVEQFSLPGLTTGSFGTNEASTGAIRVSWDDLLGGGRNLPDGATLFAVRLQVLGTIIGSTSSLLISDVPLLVEVTNPDGTLVFPTLVPGQLTVRPPNVPPTLAPVSNMTINEGALLVFTNSANDTDLPAQMLTFSLDAGFPAGAIVDPATGVFTWIPAEDQGPGIYSITVRVTDDGIPPMSAAQTFSVTVNESNSPPRLFFIADTTINEGSTLAITANAVDDDLPSQTLSFSLEPGFPQGASIDPASGHFTWTPTEAQGPGVYQITVRVTDNGSPPLSDTRPFSITVNEVNTPPVLSHIGDKMVDEGALLTFTNSATDADLPAQKLSYSLDPGFPDGVSINPTNGVFTWTPTEAQGPGSYQITVRVSDDFSPPASAAETITVTVNEVNTPPVLAHIGNKTVDEGTLLTFTNSAADADLPAQNLTYSLDPGFPAGASIDPTNGLFTWIPSEAQGPGSYQITVRVSDDFSAPASAAETITVTVNEVNTPPVLAHIGDKTVDEGTLLTFTNSASDADLPAQNLTFTLDGGAAPAGASVSASRGVFTWTPTEAQGPGIYSITVRVTDNGFPPLSAAETFTVTVNEVNTPPVLAHIGNKTVDEGSLLIFTNSATDSDLPAQNLTYSLDPGFPLGASINPTNGVFTWTPTEDQGPDAYSITVRVTDDYLTPASAAETITVTVNEVNTAPMLQVIPNWTIDENAVWTFTNSATDSDLPVQTLTYSLDPGAPAGATINPTNGVFSWIPAEAQGPGVYPVTVRVSDSWSPPASATQSFLITVNEVNAPPTLAPIGNQTLDELTLLTFTNSAADSDLPAQTLTFSLDPGFPDGASVNPTNGVFTWIPSEAQGPGVYSVTVRVTDNWLPPGSSTQTFMVTVNEVNTPPVLATRGDKNVVAGSLLTFTNLATDADLPPQTLTFSLDPGFPPGASVHPANGVFRWAPPFSQRPGAYPVHIRVSDNGVPPLSAAQMVVITVKEANTPPTLAHIGNKTVNEGTLLVFTNSAIDSDLPAQTLTFSLDPGFPPGASIDPVTGVFTWTPTDAQGPGAYLITIRVTDNGVPLASASETITITVLEVNTPPMLAHIADQTIIQCLPLSFTVSATDTDLPPQTLTFSLDPGAPLGAAIDAVTGLFSWTPREAQGPAPYPLTIRATDNGSPALSATQTVIITVIAPSLAPNIASIPDQTVFEGALLSFTVAATSGNYCFPSALSYRLDAGAPAGAAINPTNGLFTWLAPELPVPTTNPVSVVVTEVRPPSLSATQTFDIIVLKTNHPPVFVPLGSFLAQVLLPLKVTNVVTDPDIPTNRLTFAVVDGPKGVRINKFTGIVIWAPAREQAHSTNTISVSATDDGVPPFSATNTFTVVVDDYVEVGAGRFVVSAGDTGSVPLTATNSTGLTNVLCQLFVPPDHLTNFFLANVAANIQSANLVAQNPSLMTVSFGAAPGQVFAPGQTLAELNFTSISNQTSAFVPLLISNVVALQTNGLPLGRTLAAPGRVVVVGDQPLVEALPTTNAAQIVLYAQPGTNYVIEATPPLLGPNTIWQPATPLLAPTSLAQTNELSAYTNVGVFFRSRRP